MNNKTRYFIISMSLIIGLGFSLIGFGYLFAYGFVSIFLLFLSIALAFLNDYYERRYYFETFKELKEKEKK